MSKLHVLAAAAILAASASAASAATRVRTHEMVAPAQMQQTIQTSGQEQAYGPAETQFDRVWDQKIQDTENAD